MTSGKNEKKEVRGKGAPGKKKAPVVIELELTKEIVENVIEDLVARGELVRDPISGDIIDPKDTEALARASAIRKGLTPEPEKAAESRAKKGKRKGHTGGK